MLVDFKLFEVGPQDTILKAIEVISAGSRQFAVVVDQQLNLLGTITDGDVRRALLSGVSLSEPVRKIMNPTPYTMVENENVLECFRRIPVHIKQIPVVSENGHLRGLRFRDHMQTREKITTPVVIMAGGKGSRLYPLTKNLPKPMIRIGADPLLEIMVRELVSQGFHKFYFAVNYLSEIIKTHFGDGSQFGAEIIYLEETAALGTAGPLAKLKNRISENFIVMNGDLLTKTDLTNVLEFCAEQRADAAIVVRQWSFDVPFGVVEVQNTRVVGLVEKPTRNESISAGIYLLPPAALDELKDDEYLDMPNLLANFIERGAKIVAYPIHEAWIDIGRPADLEFARASWALT